MINELFPARQPGKVGDRSPLPQVAASSGVEALLERLCFFAERRKAGGALGSGFSHISHYYLPLSFSCLLEIDVGSHTLPYAVGEKYDFKVFGGLVIR